MKVKVNFSLPYKEGMENVTGYQETVNGTYKVLDYKGPMAKFQIEKEVDEPLTYLAKTEKEVMDFGLNTLCANKFRSVAINETAKQFGLSLGTEKIGKQDAKLIKALASLTNNDYRKVAKAFQASTGKELTQEEFDGIVA